MKQHEMRVQPQARLVPQVQTNRKAQIPNLLTLARVALAAVFVLMLGSVTARALASASTGTDRLGDLTHGSNTVLITAAALFIIAALTDALDGHLARKWKAVSKFGRIMDPFADKVLVLGAFVMLAGANFNWTVDAVEQLQVTGVAGWMVVLLIARELLVTSIRGVYEADGVDFSAGWSGKAKMILQSIAVPAILLLIALGNPVPGSPERGTILFLVWATVIITVVSALPYIGIALRHTIEQQAKALEIMRGAKPRKPTATKSPGAKPKPQRNKGGQGRRK